MLDDEEVARREEERLLRTLGRGGNATRLGTKPISSSSPSSFPKPSNTPSYSPPPTFQPEFNVKRCNICNNPIQSEGLELEGRSFHSQCFKCSNCNKLLNQNSGCRIQQNNILCFDCYTEKDTPFCGGCGKKITDSSYIEMKGSCFHKECFVCNTCKQPLGTSFYEMNGTYICANCNVRYLDSCAYCNEPIKERHVECLGVKYHMNCFKCVKCGTLLDGYFEVESKPHCQDCAMAAMRNK